MGRDDRNEFDPNATPPRLPSVPIIDENADGQLADDLPQYPLGHGSFLEAPPRYADGQARADVYWRATQAHLKNGVLTTENITTARFRDSTLGNTPYRYWDLDPGPKPGLIARAGIAVYNRGGWFDYHARDTTQWFGTLRGHTPDRLMMAPTGHSGLPSASAQAQGRGNAYLSYFGDTRTTNSMVLSEKLRFFDRYLRAVRDGFDSEPPVLIYVVGKGWRREDEWPLKRARSLQLSLGAQGRLEETPGPGAVDDWPVDPQASSLSQGANRWNFGIAGARAPMSLDASLPHRLAYTTAPLGADREITGHPVLELTLGSNGATTDVYAYLEDVAPNGSSLLVSEGQLRANYHRLKPPQDMLPGGSTLRVQPALPWHGYRQADFDPAPFAQGQAVRMVFDLMPTAWRFPAGHRIRLSLAGADQESFEASPAHLRDQDAGTGGAAVPLIWQLRRGAGQSVLVLPWIP
jgi:putative CocE/NonD family hydrolase